jgi:hypothetical protein
MRFAVWYGRPLCVVALLNRVTRSNHDPNSFFKSVKSVVKSPTRTASCGSFLPAFECDEIVAETVFTAGVGNRLKIAGREKAKLGAKYGQTAESV